MFMLQGSFAFVHFCLSMSCTIVLSGFLLKFLVTLANESLQMCTLSSF